METSQLPVYNKARRLYEQFEQSTQKAPINRKRGVIHDIEEQIIGLMCDISFANEQEKDRRSRLEYIARAAQSIHSIKVKVRILYDLRIVTKKGFAAIILEEENVARQLAGWEKKTYEGAE